MGPQFAERELGHVHAPAGKGNHFMIVDGIKTVDGVDYYMTRDPYAGPRGVRADMLNGVMSNGINAIVMGK
jgi:filamentous hemagglutinin